MEAVILAGGRGTRLQPYTNFTPKPLVPVAGIPVVELLVGQLVRSGVSHIHVCLSDHAAEVESVLGDGARFGVVMRYYYEETPLSTVAPLKLIDNLPEYFVAVNGDILTDIDFRAVYDRHVASDPALTVVTCRRENLVDFGVMEVDPSGCIVGFTEKPRQTLAVSAGIYCYSRRILGSIPAAEAYGFDDLMRDLLRKSEVVESYPYSGYWLDIGRPDDYERANLEIRDLPHLMP